MNKYGLKKLKNEYIAELKSEEKKGDSNKIKVKHLKKKIQYLASEIKNWIPTKKKKAV
jgi:hypothetical protein